MLEPLGLGPDDEAVYLRLVDAPHLTSLELASGTRLPTAAVEQVVGRLRQRGLVVDAPGQPGCWAAVEPAIGLATVLADRQEQVRCAEGQLAQAQAVAAQLAERFRIRGMRHPIDLIDVVVGQSAVLERFQAMELRGVREIRGIDMPPYLSTDNPTEREQLSRGVASRWLYDQTALDRPGKLQELADFQRYGEQARMLADAPFKLVLVDDVQGMILLTDEDSGTVSALMVGPSALLEGLSRTFEALWRNGVRLQPDDEVPGVDVPTAEQSQLLAMLVAGLTDKAIARQLDMSMRTAHTRVQQLMALLEADTRFQAGVQAKARGWL